jgi:uncharacterized membrane protein YdjX (TVP38/TMEM64 family)
MCVLLVGGTVVWRLSPWGRSVSAGEFQSSLQQVRDSVWAPVLFITFYALGCVVGIPGTLFGLTGGTVFGMPWAFVYNTLGGNLGASAGFFTSRLLGRDFVKDLLSARAPDLEARIARSGFTTVFVLRLFGFPFNALNFAAGLVAIRWAQFALASFLGMVPGTFVVSYFAASLASGFSTREAAVSLGLRGGLIVLLVLSRYAHVWCTRRARPSPDGNATGRDCPSDPRNGDEPRRIASNNQ